MIAPPYEFSGSIDDVILKLQNDSKCLLEWFEANYLKPNPDKWHLILSDKNDNLMIQIGNECIFNSDCEKILGIHFDNKLNFETHLSKLCKKASQKLHALARISSFMSVRQKKIIMHAFIQSQFSYCPLLWMCHSRSIHTKINKIHERSLRIVFGDNLSSFQQLLEKSGSVSIHHRNLQLLAVEIYKAINNLSPSLMSELFKIKDMKYKLRDENIILSSKIHTVSYGIDSVSHLGPRIWKQIPDEIKSSNTLTIFKDNIKAWIPKHCPCRLCKV